MTEQDIKNKYLKIHNSITESFNKGEIKPDDFKIQHDAVWAKCDIELMDNGFIDDKKSVPTSIMDSTPVLIKTILTSYYDKAKTWLDLEITKNGK